MMETMLSKVGNSMAVLLPKTLRTEACLEPDTPLRLESPRKGVVVITSLYSDTEDRLERLKAAETRIKKRRSRIKQWPENLTAEDILQAGKDSHSHELTSL